MSWFVYVDWTCEPIPRAYYVGKGNKRRVDLLVRNKKHQGISDRHGQRREVVLETIDESFAHEIEILLINMHQTYVYDNVDRWGANFTRGGDGNSGWIPSEETRRHISAGKTGARMSADVCELRRKHALEQGQRPDVQEKKSRALKGRPKTEEHRANIRLGAKKRPPISEETRRKHSEAMKRAWAEGRKKGRSS